MACDPTLPICDSLCQTLIINVWRQCKNVCLPDGYFFDPSMLSNHIVSINLILKSFCRANLIGLLERHSKRSKYSSWALWL